METTGIDATTAELLKCAVHNLNGPSVRLRLLCQLLARNSEAMDEDSRTLLKHVEDSAAAVGVVADGLRNYSEVCSRTLHREPVDLTIAAAAAVAGMQNEIASLGGQVTHGTLPTVHADRFLMTWVFHELLANAIRFRAAEPPQVCMSTASGGPGTWFVSIVDNGPGIEPHLSERLFLPFKKLSAAGGSGLGLTICRNIIERHEGRIWSEPREGGAEFRFFVGEVEPCA